MAIQAVNGPNAWRAADMHARRNWLFELDSQALQAIDAALAQVRARGLSIPFGAQDFPLPAMAGMLDAIKRELEQESGVALIRGLDVDRYGLDGTRLVYWGLGAHLGTALAQNPRADLLVNVRDEGGDPYKDPTQRGYHTSQYLPFHNDQGDAVGLLCFRPAKEGGLSCVCSAGAIHNEILRTRPDLAEVLYGPFYADVRGEEPAGRKPYYVEPRYAVFDGKFYAQHGPTYIKSAQRFPEVPRLTPQQLEAMALIDTLAASDEFRLDMGFRQGDVQFLNNHLVLHSRTGFEDFAEPDRKRHLLRLWLNTPHYQRIPPFFEDRHADMAHWLRHPVRPDVKPA
ncbi:MAG: Taurine catabolism dioxygenase TauD, TfdA family [Rhizobacter sp.]|nr:Taurine catabolism dioxygenase TauD, TfdA family [Rhizobacter sp.]